GSQQFQYPLLYNGLVPSVEPHTHCVDATISTFRWLGLQRSVEAPQLRFESHPREAEKMRTAMQTRNYAVIHPGALLATKRWAPGRFAAVARALQEEGLAIALTGGPGDEPAVAAVAAEVSNASILYGLTIPELAELIRGARLYIG